MLFFISHSFGKSLESGCSESRDCLSRLLDSRKRGLLLIYSSPRTEALIKNFLQKNDSIDNAKLFHSISKKFREKKQLLKELSTYIFISSNTTRSLRQRGPAISISPSFNNISNLLYPPILLGENLNDCDLYANKIAANFLENIPISLSTLKLSDRFEQGGGHATHRPYRRHKEKAIDLCFCIVDSDRRTPKQGLGETAKLVVAVDEKMKSPLCQSHVVDVYSAENLLPLSAIKKQYDIGKGEKELNAFNVIKELRTKPAWQYLPLKKGIKGSDLKNEAEINEHWKEELSKMGIKIPCCMTDNCTCSLVPRVNEKTLETALADETLDWNTLLNSEKNEILLKNYHAIAIKIRSWLCIGTPIRAC